MLILEFVHFENCKKQIIFMFYKIAFMIVLAFYEGEMAF